MVGKTSFFFSQQRVPPKPAGKMAGDAQITRDNVVTSVTGDVSSKVGDSKRLYQNKTNVFVSVVNGFS